MARKSSIRLADILSETYEARLARWTMVVNVVVTMLLFDGPRGLVSVLSALLLVLGSTLLIAAAYFLARRRSRQPSVYPDRPLQLGDDETR